MVVREGFARDLTIRPYITRALRNTHLRQCITVSSILKWLSGCSRCRPRVTQRPIHYNVFRDVRTLATEHNSVGLRWPRFQKTGFRTEDIVLIILLLTSTRRLPLSLSFYFHFSLYPSQPLESASCRPQS